MKIEKDFFEGNVSITDDTVEELKKKTWKAKSKMKGGKWKVKTVIAPVEGIVITEPTNTSSKKTSSAQSIFVKDKGEQVVDGPPKIKTLALKAIQI